MQNKHQEMIAAFQDVYEKVSFYGVYVKYGYCIKCLMSLLKLEDPAELHYIMMHLARLSCISDAKGKYLWASQRYKDLHGCKEFSALAAHTNTELFDEKVAGQLKALQSIVFHLNEVASTLIHSSTESNSDFNSHVKIYPIYDEAGQVVSALSIFTEVVSRQSLKPMGPSHQENLQSTAMLAIA